MHHISTEQNGPLRLAQTSKPYVPPAHVKEAV